MKTHSSIWLLSALVASASMPASGQGASAPVSHRAVMKTRQQQIEKDAAVVKNNRMMKCGGLSGDNKKGCEAQASADAKTVKDKEESKASNSGGAAAAKP
jgi:hypothetical protein